MTTKYKSDNGLTPSAANRPAFPSVNRYMKIVFLSILIFTFYSCTDRNHDLCYTDTFVYIDKKNNNEKTEFYGFKELKSAINCAKNQKKNILLIFSGIGINNRGKEWKTIKDSDTKEYIEDNFVLLWLPVDDKTWLAKPYYGKCFENEVYIQTIGQENSIFQLNLTNLNYQPLFCFIDTNSETYSIYKNDILFPDHNKFRTFLKSEKK